MQIPHVAMFVNDKEEFVMSHVMLLAGEPLDVERPLKALSDRGFDEAAKGIGSVVLALLQDWYPTQMEKYPSLKAPYDESENMSMILALIGKCLSQKSTVHLQTIDALIEEVLRGNPDLHANSTIKTWPELRERLVRRAV